MIFIKNTQRKIRLDNKKIKKIVQKILELLDYSDFNVNIWFTTNNTIKKYNKNYRNKNKPTDILSFPYHPNLKPDKKIKNETEDDKNLGDIIISPEYATESIERLLVHGLCHLIGYDHINDKDYKIMYKKEMSILSKL